MGWGIIQQTIPYVKLPGLTQSQAAAGYTLPAITFEINDIQFVAQFDTGSPMNVISGTFAQKMNLNRNNTTRGYGFSDEDNDDGHQVLLGIPGTDIQLSTIVYVFPDDELPHNIIDAMNFVNAGYSFTLNEASVVFHTV